MRYSEVLEAAKASRASIAAENRRRARERIAAADQKRADAARDYQDDLGRAHDALRKAKAELGRSCTIETAGEVDADAALFERTVRYLRDRHGILLGTLHPVGRILQAKDRHGRIVGWYDPRTDQTRDRSGSIFGTGDLLAALVICQND